MKETKPPTQSAKIFPYNKQIYNQPEKPIGAVERNETRQCGSVLLGMVFGLHLLKKQF
jgi:hypothetical protein